jgi:catechol 2,3-dioxygenase-like lactoylglutathione lyase family enzyme
VTAVVGLHHVQVAAPTGCEPQARWFYGELLGLAELEKPPVLRARGGAWFSLGDQQLHVGVQPAFSPARKAHPALLTREDALEPLAARLLDAGVRVAWDEAIDGVRRFFAEDPWGNRVEFVGGA